MRSLATLFAFWLPLAGLGCTSGGEPAGPPSIVLVTLDTLRRDHVGCYGGAQLTPNLDTLAGRGLLHRSAYTTMPTTGPAHLSLLTGLYPSEHGSLRNGEPLRLSLSNRDLATRLGAAGYVSGAFVTSAVLGLRAVGLTGFDVYDAPSAELRPGSHAVAAALDWLREEDRRPVFLWLHLYDPHSPYGRPDTKALQLPLDPASYGFVDPSRYLSGEARRRMARRYAEGVGEMDDALGALLSGLRDQLADPLIVAVADHGEALDEHLDERGYAYDHGEFLDPEAVAIPLVLAGPGVVPGRSSGTVSIRDLYTTLLEAGGVGDPEAAAAGRRDLRTPEGTRRVVGLERRRFRSEQPESVRSHRAAAAVARRVVVVDEAGRTTLDTRPGPPADELVAAARQRAGLPAVAPDREIDPATREALKSLGYVE